VYIRTALPLLASLAFAAGLSAQDTRLPRAGQSVPDFKLPDQNGKLLSFRDITGPNGALLVFYRSADW